MQTSDGSMICRYANPLRHNHDGKMTSQKPDSGENCSQLPRVRTSSWPERVGRWLEKLGLLRMPKIFAFVRKRRAETSPRPAAKIASAMKLKQTSAAPVSPGSTAKRGNAMLECCIESLEKDCGDALKCLMCGKTCNIFLAVGGAEQQVRLAC